MAITATNKAPKRELIPADNYPAICFRMIEIGTVKEEFKGEKKDLHKVRIGWELPGELKVFDEAKGPQPLVIDKEFTLSLNEKATLRKFLNSWRGLDFTEEEAKAFDITRLVGAHCLLNVIHKLKQDGSDKYNDISAATPLPKGMPKPAPINHPFILSYDDWSWEKFDSLPDFIKDKMKATPEFAQLQQPYATDTPAASEFDHSDDDNSNLPF